MRHWVTARPGGPSSSCPECQPEWAAPAAEVSAHWHGELQVGRHDDGGRRGHGHGGHRVTENSSCHGPTRRDRPGGDRRGRAAAGLSAAAAAAAAAPRALLTRARAGTRRDSARHLGLLRNYLGIT